MCIAHEVANIWHLNTNLNTNLRLQQQKVRQPWHAVVVVSPERSQRESTSLKASCWLPPSHTSSLDALDLLGLGSCVGIKKEREREKVWERWVYVHHHSQPLIHSSRVLHLCFRRQGIRLIKHACPAANNVHIQGLLKFTQEEMTLLGKRWDASLWEKLCVAPAWWDDKISH